VGPAQENLEKAFEFAYVNRSNKGFEGVESRSTFENEVRMSREAPGSEFSSNSISSFYTCKYLPEAQKERRYD
jgi:hypothetical protein